MHKRNGRKTQHALRLLRAHVVGNKQEAAAHDDDHGKASARHHGRHKVACAYPPREQRQQHNGQNPEEHVCHWS